MVLRYLITDAVVCGRVAALVSYESLFAETQTLFDELRSLCDFYHHFLNSHAQLTPELVRRRQYERKVAQLVRPSLDCCLLVH